MVGGEWVKRNGRSLRVSSKEALILDDIGLAKVSHKELKCDSEIEPIRAGSLEAPDRPGL